MEKINMQSRLEELVALAPKFFASKMMGASDEAIAQVEVAAGSILSNGHRTLLQSVGATMPGEMYPFLYGQDVSTKRLLCRYESIKERMHTLEPGLVCFSSEWEVDIFLRHGETLEHDPLIGEMDIEWEKFWPFETGDNTDHLGEWIQDKIVDFRLGQPDFRVCWNGPPNCSRWGKPHLQTVAVLHRLGFESIRSHPNSVHLIRETECAEIFSDSSASLAGDNLDEIKNIMAIIGDYTAVHGLHLKHNNDCERAPRD